MADDKTQGFLQRVDEIKDEIEKAFYELGLGKDEVLRVHDALDVARAAVASHGPHDGHDLNDDLAEKPEDHPAMQGQEQAIDPEVAKAGDEVVEQTQTAPEAPAAAPVGETPAAPAQQ